MFRYDKGLFLSDLTCFSMVQSEGAIYIGVQLSISIPSVDMSINRHPNVHPKRQTVRATVFILGNRFLRKHVFTNIRAGVFMTLPLALADTTPLSGELFFMSITYVYNQHSDLVLDQLTGNTQKFLIFWQGS